ncbi:glycosyltransferase family 4 protein [Paraburkholderia terrae]|uniref:glycosyltransferase family 4 protein n=1 Tax=Paraburkholderia terrae TaxID=311230 RepID=UPI00296B1C1B|nr:glycosyltransferase family 4 protein [Paraburkholderia terrae]MDW3657204.1 glycosyltransferase family 4 protein [Paraburkholderia terrae]
MQDLDLDRLQESVVKCISESQYDDAMVLIKSFAEQVINDPESVAVVFASRELDDLCRLLADAYFGNRDEHVSEGWGTVILASELVRAGGHVELIKDYLALGLFESPVRVALTDLFNRIDLATIHEWESLLGCEVFVANETSLEGKLDVLAAKLGEWNPSTILTLGHNQDVVSIVAAHFPGATSRYYIHHGDHHLSLGVTCEAFQHVDLHNMSYELCKHQIGVTGQRYWPLSAVKPSERTTRFLGRGALTTCSCGRASKFESGSYAMSYERGVASILKASRGYHVHIGDLSEAFLQRIFAELDAAGVSRDRFIHIEWVPSLAKALIEHSVDVYVGSFPLGGGKALIEAMSVGVPVVTHESYRSRYHGGGELTYPESYTWSRYDELVHIFEQWNEPLLKQQGESALRHFERYYSKEAFLTAFASRPNDTPEVPPLRTYHGNPLRNYLDIRRQRERVITQIELEKNRIFGEWKRLLSQYEEHIETIGRQQAVIERVMREKETAETSLREQKFVARQLRDEIVQRSWKWKTRNLIAVLLKK